MKRRVLSLLILFVSIAPLCASTPADDDLALFAVASTNMRGDSVIIGDSILVTLTLYSNYDFLSAKSQKGRTPQIKSAATHRYRAGRRLSQSMASYKGRRYYAVEVEQFFVVPSKLGTITFPALEYVAELTKRRSSPFFDPFAPFDPFSDFRRRSTPSLKRECKSEELKIRVVKRPPKTIDDLRRSGAHVL